MFTCAFQHYNTEFICKHPGYDDLCTSVASINNWGIKLSNIFSDANILDSLPRNVQIHLKIFAKCRVRPGALNNRCSSC